MKVTIHGTEVASTHHDEDHIRVEVKDRDGNVIQLFFDTADDLALLAHEGQTLVDVIRVERRLARIQPCGCVVCICEDDKKCQGCGAKHCGSHPVSEIPHPVYSDEVKP